MLKIKEKRTEGSDLDGAACLLDVAIEGWLQFSRAGRAMVGPEGLAATVDRPRMLLGLVKIKCTWDADGNPEHFNIRPCSPAEPPREILGKPKPGVRPPSFRRSIHKLVEAGFIATV